MAAGDRRGELIQLQVSIENAPPERLESLRAAERALFHALSDQLGLALLAGVDAQWSRGHVRSLHAPPPPAMRSSFSHPSLRFVEELVIDNPHLDLADQIDLLQSLKPRTLHTVRLKANDGEYRYGGSLSLRPLLTLPALRQLVAEASLLQLNAGGQSGAEVLELSALHSPPAVILSWQLPRLKALTLCGRNFNTWHETHQGASFVREVGLPPMEWPRLLEPRGFGDRQWAPLLRELTFAGYSVHDEDAAQLRPLLEREVAVDLSGCAVSATALARLEGTPRLRLPVGPIDGLED
ncbi:MAG: hypothetical protein QM723_04760 [Myxococcaceae bacterium]